MKKLCCPQCEGNIKINHDNNMAICEFCGTSFSLEKNDTEKNHKQKILEEIAILKEIEDNELCRKKFKKLMKKYPADYEIYWEYVLYCTWDLSTLYMGVIDTETILEAQEYAHKAAKLAPEPMDEELEEKWEAYVLAFNQVVRGSNPRCLIKNVCRKC